MIKTLNEFNDSFKKLNSKWSQFDDFNDLCAIDKYPFKKSFDELTLEVDLWVKESIKELK